ncbi:hypothetical protein PoB_002826400 [Plakobranchus ocellatus]|uniref:Uncharacterized protein n=1 Tax=Plakobranchus ocellatus TaxID=259542 RepID=A0AAV4A2B3_9GAST|nr:hypothetical protein PoB_002826400 [Plakobranchus ocellatus]
MIKRMEGIKSGQNVEVKETQEFLEVFQGDWHGHITATASQSLERGHFNKSQVLPGCEDGQKLYVCVKNVEDEDDYASLATYSPLPIFFSIAREVVRCNEWLSTIFEMV